MHPFIRRARRPEPMTSGSIPGHLIRYAIPAVLGNLFQVTGGWTWGRLAGDDGVGDWIDCTLAQKWKAADGLKKDSLKGFLALPQSISNQNAATAQERLQSGAPHGK